MQLFTASSIWWIFVCLLAGGAYSWLLYRRTSDIFQPVVVRLLALFRFVVVSIIAFLLLSPVIRTVTTDKQRPLLILALDESESMLHPDSLQAVRNVLPALDRMQDRLSSKFEVHRIAFSDKVSEGVPSSFKGQQTDYSALVNDLNTRYTNRNVGAVVVVSDGLYNKGGNPVYTPFAFKAPLFTVAMGDTVVRKDALIPAVNHNKVVYLGNTFPIEVSVDARQCSGSALQLTVKEGDTTLFVRSLAVAGNRYRTKVPVLLEARRRGVMRLKVSISSVPGEISLVNNQRDVFIEVRSAKEKILLVGNGPHPDMGCIKETMERTGNFEVEVVTVDKWNGAAADRQLVVFHNLPSKDYDLSTGYPSVKKSEVPVLFILGAQTDLNALSRLDAGLSVVTGNPGKTNVVTPSLSDGFSLFTLDSRLKERMLKFPPLHAPFGDYKTTVPGSNLFNQRIGTVESQEPLVFFAQTDRVRTGFVCGEGIWRWPLAELSAYGDADVSRDLILKTVQYLSLKEERSRFRIRIRNSFNENEPVVVDAELFNDNQELVNTPEVSFNIFDQDGRKFPFVFSRTDRAYLLEAGYLPPGAYRYEALAVLGSRTEKATGEFTVAEVRAEQVETVADHSLLSAWSAASGGELFQPGELDRLTGLLDKEERSKAVTYARVRLQDLIELPWLFILLLLFLTVEWLVRKRSGSY